MSRALIFANGTLNVGALATVDGGWDVILAADGGLRHCFRLGLNPQALIGDMDSAPNELVQLAERAGTVVYRFPTDKDKTDLELAIDHAQSQDMTEIVVAGGLGGRMDHAIANILLPSNEAYGNLTIQLVGGGESGSTPDEAPFTLTTVTSSFEVEGSPGDIVSLLPVGGDAGGIRTSGLKYALADETLKRGSTRGVSNIMLADRAEITVSTGCLLAIHLPSAVPAESSED